VLVLRDGRALQCSPPLDLYARPADLFTATFVGSPRMTIWRGSRRDGMLALRGLDVPVPAGLGTSGRDLCVGIRPEDVEIKEVPLSGGLEGVVELTEAMGDRTLLTIRVGEEALRVLAAARPWPENLWLRLPAEKLHWFDAESERRLVPAAEPR